MQNNHQLNTQSNVVPRGQVPPDYYQEYYKSHHQQFSYQHRAMPPAQPNGGSATRYPVQPGHSFQPADPTPTLYFNVLGASPQPPNNLMTQPTARHLPRASVPVSSTPVNPYLPSNFTSPDYAYPVASPGHNAYSNVTPADYSYAGLGQNAYSVTPADYSYPPGHNNAYSNVTPLVPPVQYNSYRAPFGSQSFPQPTNVRPPRPPVSFMPPREKKALLIVDPFTGKDISLTDRPVPQVSYQVPAVVPDSAAAETSLSAHNTPKFDISMDDLPRSTEISITALLQPDEPANLSFVPDTEITKPPVAEVVINTHRSTPPNHANDLPAQAAPASTTLSYDAKDKSVQEPPTAPDVDVVAEKGCDSKQSHSSHARVKYTREFLMSLSEKCRAKPASFPSWAADLKKNNSASMQVKASESWVTRGGVKQMGPKYAAKTQAGYGHNQNGKSPTLGGKLPNTKLFSQPGRLAINPANVAPLPKSDSRWHKSIGTESKQGIIRKKVQGLLNKLTVEKRDSLSSQLSKYISDELEGGNWGDIMDLVIRSIVDKAVREVAFSEMYAELCCYLARNLPEDFSDEAARKENRPEGGVSNPSPQMKLSKTKFSKKLRSVLQKELEKELQCVPEGSSDNQRNRALGNIRFVGELFKKSLVSFKIISKEIITPYLQNYTDDKLELVCKLLTTIGKDLEKRSEGRFLGTLRTYVGRIHYLVVENKINSPRIRFMCEDLLDLRKNDWVPRIIAQKATTINEVKNSLSGDRYSRPTARPIQINSRPPVGPTSIRTSRPAHADRYAINDDQSARGHERTLSEGSLQDARYSADHRREEPESRVRERRVGSMDSTSGRRPSLPNASSGDFTYVEAEVSADTLRVKSFLAEFTCNPDSAALEYACQCMQNVFSDRQVLVVSESIDAYINTHQRSHPIITLLSHLLVEKLLTPTHIMQGLETYIPLLAELDFPNATKFVGDLLAHFVPDVLSLKNIVDSVDKELLSKRDREALFAHVLLGVSELRGESAAVSVWIPHSSEFAHFVEKDPKLSFLRT